MFPQAWAVTVTDTWDPNRWIRDTSNKIFIIDEAEEVIENNLLGLNGTGFTGLAALRRQKVYCFTATLTAYWRHCFCYCFN